MQASEIIALSQGGVWTMIKIGAPIMIVALITGLVISLLQALTQIQEMTLSFVPKILAIMLTFVLTMPFMLGVLSGYTEDLFARIAKMG
ncbi:MAG: flagellar biosynthesis protein FliQ [Pseudomonadota bacterium]